MYQRHIDIRRSHSNELNISLPSHGHWQWHSIAYPDNARINTFSAKRLRFWSAKKMKNRRHHSLADTFSLQRIHTQTREIRKWFIEVLCATYVFDTETACPPNQTESYSTLAFGLPGHVARLQRCTHSYIEIHTIVNSIVRFCRALLWLTSAQKRGKIQYEAKRNGERK